MNSQGILKELTRIARDLTGSLIKPIRFSIDIEGRISGKGVKRLSRKRAENIVNYNYTKKL